MTIYPKRFERKWIILFSGAGCEEWETVEGTLEDARKQAECSNRHMNYGRTGYAITPDFRELIAQSFKEAEL